MNTSGVKLVEIRLKNVSQLQRYWPIFYLKYFMPGPLCCRFHGWWIAIFGQSTREEFSLSTKSFNSFSSSSSSKITPKRQFLNTYIEQTTTHSYYFKLKLTTPTRKAFENTYQYKIHSMHDLWIKLKNFFLQIFPTLETPQLTFSGPFRKKTYSFFTDSSSGECRGSFGSNT